jgi:WD40 repeat protein
MNEREERMFADFLREGPERGPADGPTRVFDLTREMPQRPAWTFMSRWTGAVWPDRRIVVPAVLLGVLLLLLAMAAVVLVGGSRHRAAPLTGPAEVGYLAWDTGEGGQVFIAGPDGSSPHPLLGADPISRRPTFSRDGTMLAFWTRANTDQGTLMDLYVAKADGTGARKINGDQGVSTNVFFSPEFSPDNREVVFGAVDGDVSRLYVAAADGSGVQPLTAADAIRDAPTWSPNGQRIAFRKQTLGDAPVSSVAVIHPDGSGEHDLSSRPTAPGGGPYDGLPNGPVWAPDSSAVGYTWAGDGTSNNDQPSHAYLWVATLDGQERRLYDEASGAMSWPDWSPDGVWIAIGLRDSAPGEIILVRPDGSERRVVVDDLSKGGDCGVAWAPDARSVALECLGFPRYALDDLEHPVLLRVPSDATGVGWQRGPLP